MKKLPIAVFLIVVIAVACKKNEFRVCSDLLAPCAGTQQGSYCLFGYKWGEQALHEVGHVLGLGHVNSDNIMQIGRGKNSFVGLQEGDIEGIIAIYGPK